MKVPVQVSVVALIVNLVLALALIQPLAHIGLALAVSIAALVNAGLLWWALRNKGFYTPIVGWLRLVVQSVFAAFLMALSLWWLESIVLSDWALASGLERAGALLLLVVAGMLIYALALLLFGMRKRDWVL